MLEDDPILVSGANLPAMNKISASNLSAFDRSESGLYETLGVKVIVDNNIPKKQIPIILKAALSCHTHNPLCFAYNIIVNIQLKVSGQS